MAGADEGVFTKLVLRVPQVTVVISSRSTDNIVCTHLKQNKFRFYIYQAILKRVFTLSERILNKVTFYVSSST